MFADGDDDDNDGVSLRLLLLMMVMVTLVNNSANLEKKARERNGATSTVRVVPASKTSRSCGIGRKNAQNLFCALTKSEVAIQRQHGRRELTRATRSTHRDCTTKTPSRAAFQRASDTQILSPSGNATHTR